MSSLSARAYWIEWRILKRLPYNYIDKVASTLHVKIPVTPMALAGSLLMTAGGFGERLLNTIEIRNELNPVSEKEEIVVLGELLRALYCLAVIILGNDAFASGTTDYNFYMAETYQEIRKLMAEKAPQIISKEMMDEATLFYLNDKPSLAEYAEEMQDFWLGHELEKAKNSNWIGQFMLKVNIRVAAALGITSYNFEPHLILTTKIFQQLINLAKLFERLRPVIQDPTEPDVV